MTVELNPQRPTAPATWHRTTVGTTSLAWTESGQGPLTVWVHPLASSSLAPETFGPFDWEPVAAAGRRLVRYDARGHGRSTGAADPQDYTFANLARDLLGLLDEISPHDPVSAIGMSLGTATLLHAATTAPERFERLVLTAPPTAWEARAPQAAAYEAMAALVDDGGKPALEAALRGAPVPAPLADAGGMSLPVDIDERVLSEVLRGVATADLPTRDAVARLRLPVLILPWAGDPVHPLATAEQLAALIPGSVLEVGQTGEDLRGWGARIAKFLTA